MPFHIADKIQASVFPTLMWRFFASGKFELNLKCLSSHSPFAQPRAAAVWQCLFPQKKQFLHEHAAHHDKGMEGTYWRAATAEEKVMCLGSVLQPCTAPCVLPSASGLWGFCSNTRSASSTPSITRGKKKKKKRSIVGSLKGWYVTGWVSVLYYPSPHPTAWQAPAEGGAGASSALSCCSADQFVFLNMTTVAAKPDNEKLKVK